MTCPVETKASVLAGLGGEAGGLGLKGRGWSGTRDGLGGRRAEPVLEPGSHVTPSPPAEGLSPRPPPTLEALVGPRKVCVHDLSACPLGKVSGLRRHRGLWTPRVAGGQGGWGRGNGDQPLQVNLNLTAVFIPLDNEAPKHWMSFPWRRC